MKQDEPKRGKKEIYYDILNGQKRFYVGRRMYYRDGSYRTERLTGYFYSEAEANRNK